MAEHNNTPEQLHQRLISLCRDLNPSDWQALAEVQACLSDLSKAAPQVVAGAIDDINARVDALILEQTDDPQKSVSEILHIVTELEITAQDDDALAEEIASEAEAKTDDEDNKSETTEESDQARIERIASLVMSVNPRDWQQMAELTEALRPLSESDHTAIAEMAQKIISELDAIILEQVDDVDQAMQAINEHVSSLQWDLDDQDPQQPAAGTPNMPQDGTTSLSMRMVNGPINEFIIQHESTMDELEGILLGLEKCPNAESEAEFKRQIHTIKGEAGFLGLEPIASWAHAIEDMIDQAGIDKCISVLLKLLDWFRNALKQIPNIQAIEDSYREVTLAIRAVSNVQAANDAADAQTPEANAQNGSGTEQSLDEDPAGEDEHHPSATDESVAPGALVSDDTKAMAQAMPLPEDVDQDTLQEFISESGDHLASIESSLLAIEGSETIDPEQINSLFRGFHTIKGLAGFLQLSREQKLAHVTEELLDKVRSNEMEMDEQVIQHVFRALDAMQSLIDGLSQAIDNSEAMPACQPLPEIIGSIRATLAGQPAKLGELLVESHVVKKADVDEALTNQKQTGHQQSVGEILVETGKLSQAELAKALKKQAGERNTIEKKKQKNKADAPAKSPAAAQQAVNKAVMMKVDASRIDDLADVIGELVVAQGMLNEADPTLSVGSRAITTLLSRFERITRNLQDMATNLRMVPVGPVFQRMARLCRDLSRKMGKPVEFKSEGNDVELDKTLVDRLADPLVHMVRNSIDHGLEDDPNERVRSGKAATGTVTLRAFHEGGHIHVEISDDGKGLDRNRILEKAIERELIQANHQLSDSEVDNLIFHPGFSTAAEVTDVSGRGVGMDVVKRMVQDLRGQIMIRTQPGEGTTFTFVLPLTAAIIDGMLVSVAGQRYIIPTLSIITSLRPKPEDVSGMMGWGQLLELQGQHLPVFDLASVFDLDPSLTPQLPTAEEDKHESDKAPSKLAVVATDGATRVALLVDDLLGRQQVVIKPLGDGLPKVPGISGATITGDGRVCLILDTGGLIRYTMSHPTKSSVEA